MVEEVRFTVLWGNDLELDLVPTKPGVMIRCVLGDSQTLGSGVYVSVDEEDFEADRSMTSSDR